MKSSAWKSLLIVIFVATAYDFASAQTDLVKGDRIVRARPGKQDAVNKGALCVRGSYGFDFVHSPERLTGPLKRTEGGFAQGQ